MKWIFQRFFSPTKLCDMVRIQCAACSGFGVRHTPDSLCGMLRIMQSKSDHLPFGTTRSWAASGYTLNKKE